MPDLWAGRRRATWLLQGSRLPLGFALSFALVAAGLGLVRLLVGPIVSWPVASLGWWFGPVVVGVVLTAALGDIGEGGADLWLRRRDVASTPSTRALVRRWLPLTRTLRGVGFFAPFAVTGVAAWLTNAPALPGDHLHRAELTAVATLDGVPGVLSLAAAGYALGALAAEFGRSSWLRRRIAPATSASADLRPRTPEAYAMGLARWGPRALATGALVTAGLAAGQDLTTRFTPAAVVMVAVAALVTVEGSRALVVRRRQRVPDPLAADADDAARASTLHGVAGAAIAAIGGAWGPLFSDLALTAAGPVRHLTWVGAVLVLMSTGLWIGFGTDLVWTVRRGGQPPTPRPTTLPQDRVPT